MASRFSPLETSARQQALSQGVGLLTSSPNGNVRYEPRASQWTSVLANTNVSADIPSMDDQDSSCNGSGFPLTAGPVPSLDELLLIITPDETVRLPQEQILHGTLSGMCALVL